LPVVQHLHVVAVAAQAPDDSVRDDPVVLDDEDPGGVPGPGPGTDMAATVSGERGRTDRFDVEIG